jgi:hypothetical protein
VEPFLNGASSNRPHYVKMAVKCMRAGRRHGALRGAVSRERARLTCAPLPARRRARALALESVRPLVSFFVTGVDDITSK